MITTTELDAQLADVNRQLGDAAAELHEIEADRPALALASFGNDTALKRLRQADTRAADLRARLAAGDDARAELARQRQTAAELEAEAALTPAQRQQRADRQAAYDRFNDLIGELETMLDSFDQTLAQAMADMSRFGRPKPPPRVPGDFVSNFLTVERWPALESALTAWSQRESLGDALAALTGRSDYITPREMPADLAERRSLAPLAIGGPHPEIARPWAPLIREAEALRRRHAYA